MRNVSGKDRRNSYNINIETPEKQRYTKTLEIISRYPHKRILDVGCAGMPGETDILSGNWLHGFIVSQFPESEVIGIDINKEAVEILKERGYNVELMDAENFNFEKKFDVIVAAELIEHLNNPGTFMSSCARNLKDGGVLIISTPYPFNLDYFMSNHFKKGGFEPGRGHTAWFCPKTLGELAKRYGFKMKEVHFVEYNYQPEKYTSLRSFVYHKLLKSFIRFIGFSKLFRGGFISVLQLKE